MFKRMSRLLVVITSLAGLSASFTVTSAFAEDSLYARLGGTYNIASTVDYLVDMIYINNGFKCRVSIQADRKSTRLNSSHG